MKYCVAILFLLSTSAYAADTLYVNEVLTNNGYIQSQDSQYKLIMQSDGSLVMYRSDGSIRYRMEKYGSYARMESSGNFAEYNSNNVVIWETKTGNTRNNRLTIQNDGNLVVYSPYPISSPQWSIGADPGPNDPQQIGDVVGRDLSFTGAGYLGHLGIWDGGNVAQVGPPKSGNNAVYWEPLSTFKNIPTTTGGIAEYWGVAPAPISQGIKRDCYGTYCSGIDGIFENTTQRVATAKRARQIYLVGADYTSTAYYIPAMARTMFYSAIRGEYRCDTFVLDVLLDSTDGIIGEETAEQKLWRERASTLNSQVTAPRAIFDKLRSYTQ